MSRSSFLPGRLDEANDEPHRPLQRKPVRTTALRLDNPVAKIEAFLRDGKRPAAQAVIESERAAKRLDPDLRSLEGGAAVARVKGTATGDGLEAASRWLAEESEPYRGDWVLLDGDRVVYHGPSESTGRSHAASLTHPVLVFVE